MEAGDVAAVERLLKESPEAAQWTPGILLRKTPGGACAWVAVEGEKVVGMIAARTAAGEAELLNLAILPAYRRRGLGKRLLECAIDQVRKAGAGQLFLEVRETNATAREFYAKMGFGEAGRRRGYYRNPTEDAFVLTLKLDKN